MHQYRLAVAAALLGVSDDTLRRWADGGRLVTSLDKEGRRVVAGDDLAAFAVEQAGEPEGSRHSSARNRFEGIVTRVVRGDVVSQVELQCGPHRVVSLLSTEAVDALGLVPGAPAIAAVKSTNVVVELP